MTGGNEAADRVRVKVLSPSLSCPKVVAQDLLLYVVGSTSSPPAAHKLLLSGSRLAVRDLLEGAGLLDGQVGWCGSP